MEQELAQAQALYNRGSLSEAANICNAILARNNRNGAAYHILGLIHLQQGNHGQAQELLERSIGHSPDNVAFLYNYGFALQETGQFEAALAIFKKVISLKPDFPEASFSLGNLLLSLSKNQEAIQAYKKAVSLNPQYVEALNNLGAAYKAINDLDNSIATFNSCLALQPENADTLFNLAMALQLRGDIGDAIEKYRKAAALAPDLPDLYYNFGIALHEAGNAAGAEQALKKALEQKPADPNILNQLALSSAQIGKQHEAIKLLQQAIALKPDFADAHSNLGNIYLDMENFPQAESAYRKALALKPSFTKANYNLGNCCKEQNRLQEAATHYRNAIALDPALVEAHWNLSHALLLQGEYEEGFREYLWRWRRKNAPVINYSVPEWRGEKDVSDTLLIHTEQGLGDSIQFIRYIPLLNAHFNSIVVSCEKPLIELFSHCSLGIDRIIEKGSAQEGGEMSSCQAHAPLLNLPTIFETTLNDVPDEVPYLSPDPKFVKKHAVLFREAGNTLKVGVVWKGSSGHKNDHHRSCTLEQFSTFFDIPAASFFSLQKDVAPSEVHPQLKNLAPHLTSFADTAAMIAQLDLLVSVDTSVAHLAGAMGKPVWTLLPFSPDWRWLLGTDSSPWYPTMRLFRQRELKNWDEVFQRVRKALLTFSESR